MLAQAAPARAKRPAEKAHAHYDLRIAPCKLEIAPGIVIETLGYNGQVPGPILQVREGVPITIDVTNQTAAADIVPWDGLAIDWTINNQSWPKIDPLQVGRGGRSRMIFRNGSGDQHPMHLHRHSFEVTRVGTKEFSGLRKDVVNIMPLDSVAVDLVVDNPGDTLPHCHQALHMDFGFMQLIKYAG